MHTKVCRVTATLFAACLLAGVPFHLSQRTTQGQQREKRANKILRERGVLESASAVEVRNQVPGQTKIVSVVAEGTSVKKGDVLVTLDSAGIEEQIVQTKMEVTLTRAKRQQAEVKLQSIKLDGEYQIKAAQRALQVATSEKDRVLGEGGELAVEQTAIESEITIAKARLKTAEILLGRVEADPIRAEEMRLRITEARESLNVAEARKRFLDGPQRKHKTVLCDLTIAAATAELDRQKFHMSQSVELANAEVIALNAALNHVTQTLERATELLRHCQIIAPQDGLVVYPNTSGRRASGAELKEGATVRERQTLVLLPDPSQLQLKLNVDEADIDRLRVGQSATIEIDAFPDQTSTGTVTSVSTAALPNRADSDARQHVVIVSLDDPPVRAKLGLTATVDIKIDAKSTE